ncbi:MAG: hypothetical protein GC191_18420 [Azospirillum sp.]|nr:hypothetical protein [Azospirillum sp.]
MQPPPRKVFVSYSHDSAEHKARVLALANRLRNPGGLDVVLDQYFETVPPAMGWPMWMEHETREADTILVVCTETYLCRGEHRESPGVGHGVIWESVLLYNDIYGAGGLNAKIIPIVFAEADRRFIPRPLLGTSSYQIDDPDQLETLYRRLTGQPRVVRPDRSDILDLSSSAPPRWESLFGPSRTAAQAILRESTLDRAAVERAFGAASQVLFHWPQLTAGQWIERPELDRLYDLAMGSKPVVAVLLGGPGAGKSALLARLGHRLRTDGVILLALKADQLPRSITTISDLDHAVGAPVAIADALRRLAVERRVVLLIDQLDALADLMDLSPGRLSALLALIGAVRETPNLQVMLSCREFEFRNDVRLTSLESEAVALSPLAWEQVAPVVTSRGLDAAGWSSEIRDVLRVPQHLALFLDHLAGQGTPGFTTYHGLLERVAAETLENRYGRPTLAAAEEIARTMAQEEELWLGVARFSRRFRAELRNLEASGLLVCSEDRLRLAFRHQTLFDFLRARSFLADGVSIADHVLNGRQESLFVRPTLWSALHYLRSADRPTYRREFTELWQAPTLRCHLRYLLIAFLGQLAEPDDQEARWMVVRLDDPQLRPRIFAAVAGSPGWFRRLAGSILPTRMSRPPEEAWETVRLLSKAVTVERDAVLALAERHWLARPEYASHTYAVLRDLRDWDERAAGIAAQMADRAECATFVVQDLARAIARVRPDLAPEVIVRHLEAQLRQIDAAPIVEPEPLAEMASPDQQAVWWLKKDQAAFGDYEKILTNQDLHDVDKITALAPCLFIKRIWPCLSNIFERFSDNYLENARNQYREDHQHIFRRDEPGLDLHYPLPTVLEAAIGAWAAADPDVFLSFVATARSTDLMALHALLAVGLAKAAAVRPAAVLDYLLEDPRRFALGTDADKIMDSVRLIAAVAPALSETDVQCLEQAILGYQRYRDDVPDESAKLRFERQKWTREHRLTLLRAIPVERLSPEGRRRRREEERALPNTHLGTPRFSGVYSLRSPMTAAQMAKATDTQIIALFADLTDATGWNHPNRERHWVEHIGGSVQASREFAQFAKAQPERAIRIMTQFEPGRQERPASDALRELSGVDTVEPVKLLDCIQALDHRGFGSEEFRTSSAWGLGALARRNAGLDDRTCEMLERWLTDWLPSKIDPDCEASAPVPGVEPKPGSDEAARPSLLWDSGAWGVLPGENYPILEALFCGQMCRKPMNADAWLAILDRHLGRRENPKVWQAVARHLTYLDRADHARAADFFGGLFEGNPGLLRSASGVRLIAEILGWMPSDLFDRVLSGWVTGDWPRGPQAAGEIAALHLCRRPGDAAARTEVAAFLEGAGYAPEVAAGLRIGLAFTLNRGWKEPALRALVTPLLLSLIASADHELAKVLLDLFGTTDPLPADDDSRQILRALVDHPAVLGARGPRLLIHRLKALLGAGWEPELVHTVCIAVIDQAEQAGETVRNLGIEAGGLIEIALTLHRLPETRIPGLDLFERLMAFNVYGIEAPLESLDRRPFR